MPKRTINLIIAKDKEPEYVRKLRLVLPITAVCSILLFSVGFGWSYFFIRSHITQFGIIKKEVDSLERRITQQESTEGIYSLVQSGVGIITQLSPLHKSYTKVLDQVLAVSNDGITITTSSTDNVGQVQFSATATSSSALSSMVAALLKKDEQEHLFTKIESQGMVRDKFGGYNITITLKASPQLMQ